MAAATEPLLMTVEQYRQLPDREDVIQELHWGMVVTLSRPKMRHAKLQSRLVRLLRPKAEHMGVVETEVAFRALPEYDLPPVPGSRPGQSHDRDPDFRGRGLGDLCAFPPGCGHRAHLTLVAGLRCWRPGTVLLVSGGAACPGRRAAEGTHGEAAGWCPAREDLLSGGLTFC